MNGLDPVLKLREQPATASVPVIIKTANPTEETTRNCRRSGCAGCIRTLVHAEELYRAVQVLSNLLPENTFGF